MTYDRSKIEKVFSFGRKVRMHVYLAEQHIIHCKLWTGYVVHHRDHNPFNNDLSNLQVMTRADHIRIHKPILGYKFTNEQKKRLSKAHMGFKVRPETKEKLRKIHTGRTITWGDKISKAKTILNLPVDAILKLYNAGWKYKELSSLYGVSEGSIYKVIIKNGKVRKPYKKVA